MERTNPPHPQNCRLMLHTTNQYTSSKKLRDFLMSSESYLDASEAGTKKLAAMLEQEHNEAEFRQRTGQMAVFGNIYQVLVPVSNKFVQAEKHIAKEDDTCLQTKQVGHETRSKLPWFRLMPGFATRNEGDRIKMGDTVILESIKMPKMYLHCAVDNANVDDRKEVNISSDATRSVASVRRRTPRVLMLHRSALQVYGGPSCQICRCAQAPVGRYRARW